jgi:hypothetical protein
MAKQTAGSNDYQMKATGRGKGRTRKKVQTAATRNPDFNESEKLAAAGMGPRPGPERRQAGKRQYNAYKAQNRWDQEVRTLASRTDKMMPTDIAAVGDVEGRRRRRGIGGLLTPMTMRETIG